MVHFLLIFLFFEEPAARYFLDHGDQLLRSGQTEAAVSEYGRAIRMRLDNPEGWMRRGKALVALRRYHEAAADFAQGAQLQPRTVEPLLDRANALLLGEELRAAVDGADQALAKFPGNIRALQLRAAARTKLKEYALASSDYSEVIRLAPNQAQPYLDRAASLEAAGQDQEALADRNQAVRLLPDSAEVRIARATSHQKLAHSDLALADLNEAVRLRPDMPGALFARGNAYFALGQNAKAEADMREILRKYPDYKVANDLLARVQPKSSGTEVAVVSPLPSVKVDAPKPSESKVVVPLALSSLKADPPKAAVPKVAVAGTRGAVPAKPQVEVKPVPVAIQSSAAHYQRGRDFLQHNRFQDAIAELTLAIEANSTNALAFNSRGFSYYMAHDLEHASADLAEALRLNPNYENAKVNQSVVAAALARRPANTNQLAAVKPIPNAAPDNRPQVSSTTEMAAVKAASVPPMNQRRIEAPLVVAVVPALPSVSAPDAPIEQPAQAAGVTKPQPPVVKAADAASAELHHQRGRELLRHGKFPEAIAELTLTLEAKPDHVLAHNARGFAYYMARDYLHALADLNEALRIKPDYTNAQQNRSVVMKAAARAGVKVSELVKN